jgi:hypothetical protein
MFKKEKTKIPLLSESGRGIFLCGGKSRWRVGHFFKKMRKNYCALFYLVV